MRSIPYLLSKNLIPWDVAAAAAAAAGAARDRVRCSILRIDDEVSGKGPVSFKGELLVVLAPLPACLLLKFFVVVVVTGEEELHVDWEDFETLLLFRASDWCLRKEGFGICRTEALAGDFVMAILLLEAGLFVMETVLVFVVPIFVEPNVLFPVPLDELEVVEGRALGSLVMVTSGVGGDIVVALVESDFRELLDGDFDALEFVVLVPEVVDATDV